MNDEAYAFQLSIPGTHDSGTGNGFSTLLIGDQMARTQEKSIDEQWDSGIRAFDLRPAVDGGSLHVYHGIVKTKLAFGAALRTISEKLADHPTEMAFIIIRHETEADSESDQYNQLLLDELNQEGIAERLVDFVPNMRVKDLRGHILLLSRDLYADTPKGAFITGWGHNADFASQHSGFIKGPTRSAILYLQDFYDTTGDNGLTTKTSSILRMLDYSIGLATATATRYNWVVNHTSGYSKTISIFGNEVSSSDGYRENAAVQNQAVIDYLSNDSHAGPTGLVMMDYAAVNSSNGYAVNGLTLTQAIIANNFRYRMKGAVYSNIRTVDTASPSTAPCYRLDGIPLQEIPRQGIYIKDGKKIRNGVH